jgi:serine/threonine protein kinase
MSALIGTRLGQYDIVSTLGQGGMATVYRARQASMQRDVAIKVISGQLSSNPDFMTRFEHEARLIAHLQHAHILPVYDFGREGHTLFLAMRLVDGGSLDQRLRSGPLSVPETVRIFSQIASALNYAHQEGVIHRDLKPNNILLDKSGSPYLTDFGIAKVLQSSMALTATGTVMGTPSYMSPEQWRGAALDGRTDIYALGVMLYEMLTGQLPFTGETPYVLMYKHFDELPPFPGTVNPSLPQAIDDVIHKAMAKNQEDRYASADAMVAALVQAVGGNAAFAASPTPIMQRLEDNQPTIIGDADTNKAASATSALTAMPPQIIPQPQKAEQPTLKSSASQKRIRLAALLSGLLLVILLAGGGAYFISSRPLYHEVKRIEGHTNWVEAISWSPDGSKLASASDDKTIQIWNPASGESLLTLRGHTETVSSIAWSPDGSKLASTSDDKTLRVWNSTTGAMLTTLKGDPLGGPRYLAWNKDGTKLAIGTDNGKVQLWNLEPETEPVTIRSEQGWLTAIAWNPDNTKLANGTQDNAIQVWDVNSGKLLVTFPAHTGFIYALNWSPDGNKLASASLDGTVHLWDMLRDQPLSQLTIKAHNGGVNQVVWSPDGRKLATSSGFVNLGGIDDLTARIWDSDTGKLLLTLEGHIRPIHDVAWSPDGNQLATAGLDYVIRIWGK